jgi:hypothetical protein
VSVNKSQVLRPVPLRLVPELPYGTKCSEPNVILIVICTFHEFNNVHLVDIMGRLLCCVIVNHKIKFE